MGQHHLSVCSLACSSCTHSRTGGNQSAPLGTARRQCRAGGQHGFQSPIQIPMPTYWICNMEQHPQPLPLCYSTDNKSAYLLGFLWELNEQIHKQTKKPRHPEQSPAVNMSAVNVISYHYSFTYCPYLGENTFTSPQLIWIQFRHSLKRLNVMISKVSLQPIYRSGKKKKGYSNILVD